MDNKRLLMGIALFVGSFLLIWVGATTSLLGPLADPTEVQAAWREFTLVQRLFVLGCFIASAYGAGIILDSLIRLLKNK
jgi:hypothetical protein